MNRWIGIAVFLLIPFFALAQTEEDIGLLENDIEPTFLPVNVAGGTASGVDFTPFAYTPPVVIAPNQQGVAYTDTFTRTFSDVSPTPDPNPDGHPDLLADRCSGTDVCSWETVFTDRRQVYIGYSSQWTIPANDATNGFVTGGPGSSYRASMTKPADTLSQYVAAQISGPLYGRFHGVTLRGNGLVPVVDNRQYYVFRHNDRPSSSPGSDGADADAAYGIYLCRGNYDCGNGQSIYEISTQQLGVMNRGDSLGMEVNYGTGNDIVFKIWHWTVIGGYPEGPPARPWGDPSLTVCASGCDVVWTTPPENYTDAIDSTIKFTPATGMHGGFSAGTVGSSTEFDNWMFGDAFYDAQIPTQPGEPTPTPEPPPVPPAPPEGDGGTTVETIATLEGVYPSYTSGSLPPVLPADMTTSNSPAWGHLHPDCSVKYGTFPANPPVCSANNTLLGDTTYSNCVMNGTQTFAGDNITVECVRWDLAGDRIGLDGAGGSPATASWNRANKCSNPGGCKNIIISKVTMDGSYARNDDETGYIETVSGSDFLKFSTTYQQTSDPILSHTITIGTTSTYTTNFSRFVGFRTINTNKRRLESGVNNDTRPMFNYLGSTKCSLQDDSTIPIGNIHVYCGEGTSAIPTENGTLIASNVGTVDYATGTVTIFDTFTPTNATSLTLQAVAPSRHTTLIEKSLFQGNRVSIFGGYGHDSNTEIGGADLNVLGYPGYSMVISENIFRYPDYQKSSDGTINDHMEHLAIMEEINGILIRNNTFVCDEAEECNTGIALLEPVAGQGYPHGVNTIDWYGNRFVGDAAGYMINFPPASKPFCPTNQKYIGNVFEDPQTPTNVTQFQAGGFTEDPSYGVGMFSGACRPFLECDLNLLNGESYGSVVNQCIFTPPTYYQVANPPAADPTALPLYDAVSRPEGYYPGMFSTGENVDGSGGYPAGGALGAIPYGQPSIPSEMVSDGTTTPSATNNFPAWGHLHPDCVTEYGSPGDGLGLARSAPTWNITDNECTTVTDGNGVRTIAANSTVENCTLTTQEPVNLLGDNITFKCMVIDVPGDYLNPPTGGLGDRQTGITCKNDYQNVPGVGFRYTGSACKNTVFTKITTDGNWAPATAPGGRDLYGVLEEDGGIASEPFAAEHIVADGLTVGSNGRGGETSLLMPDGGFNGTYNSETFTTPFVDTGTHTTTSFVIQTDAGLSVIPNGVAAAGATIIVKNLTNGASSESVIQSYDSGTRTVTVSPALSFTPTSGNQYFINPVFRPGGSYPNGTYIRAYNEAPSSFDALRIDTGAYYTFRRTWTRWKKNADNTIYLDDAGRREAIGYYNYGITGSRTLMPGAAWGDSYDLFNDPATVLIEKSVLQGDGTHVWTDSIDGRVASVTGYPGYGLVIKENIFRWGKHHHHHEYTIRDHGNMLTASQHMFGMLVKDNIFVCDWENGMVDPDTGRHNFNGCPTSAFMVQPDTGNGSGIDVIGNVFWGDDAGPAMSWGHNIAKPGRCVLGARVLDNKFYAPVIGNKVAEGFYADPFYLSPGSENCRLDGWKPDRWGDVITECRGNKVQYEDADARRSGTSHMYNRVWNPEEDLFYDNGTGGGCIPTPVAVPGSPDPNIGVEFRLDTPESPLALGRLNTLAYTELPYKVQVTPVSPQSYSTMFWASNRQNYLNLVYKRFYDGQYTLGTSPYSAEKKTKGGSIDVGVFDPTQNPPFRFNTVDSNGDYDVYPSGLLEMSSDIITVPEEMNATNHIAWGHLHPECADIYGEFDWNNVCDTDYSDNIDPATGQIYINPYTGTPYKPGVIPPGVTLSNCRVGPSPEERESILIAGDNVTVDCVLFDYDGDLKNNREYAVSPSGPSSAFYCMHDLNSTYSGVSCQNLNIRRSTFDGSYIPNQLSYTVDGNKQFADYVVEQGATLENVRNLSGSRAFGFVGTMSRIRAESPRIYHSILVEKSLSQGQWINMQLGGGSDSAGNRWPMFDGDQASVEGYSGTNGEPGPYALVVKDNIFRFPDGQLWNTTDEKLGPEPNLNVSDHVNSIYISGPVDGVLFDNNLITCAEGDACGSSVGSFFSVTGATADEDASIRNVHYTNNRWIVDHEGWGWAIKGGYQNNWGCDGGGAPLIDVQIINNRFDNPGDTDPDAMRYGNGTPWAPQTPTKEPDDPRVLLFPTKHYNSPTDIRISRANWTTVMVNNYVRTTVGTPPNATSGGKECKSQITKCYGNTWNGGMNTKVPWTVAQQSFINPGISPTCGDVLPPTGASEVGHRQSSCEADYGLDAATIEATPCSITNGELTAGTTYTACSIAGPVTLQGSDITLDCVYMDTGTTASVYGISCDNTTSSCDNIEIKRSTLIGNNGSNSTPMTGLIHTGESTSGTAVIRMLIEGNDISGADGLISIAGDHMELASDLYAFDDSVTYPTPIRSAGQANGLNGDKLSVDVGDVVSDLRYPGYAIVVKENYLHGNVATTGGTGTTDFIAITGSPRGVLVKNNFLDSTGSIPDDGSMVRVEMSGDGPGGAGEYTFSNNHIIPDGQGPVVNFAPGASCYVPVKNSVPANNERLKWVGNEVEYTPTAGTLFNYNRAGCANPTPTLIEREPFFCAGNTFGDGSHQTCTPNGF